MDSGEHLHVVGLVLHICGMLHEHSSLTFGLVLQLN